MEEIFKESEEILRSLEKALKFSSKFNIYPHQEVAKIVKKLVNLEDNIKRNLKNKYLYFI